jgi:hypothetical protein
LFHRKTTVPKLFDEKRLCRTSLSTSQNSKWIWAF